MELYDSNILTSGKGAQGVGEGPLVQGTNTHEHGPHGPDGLVAHQFMDLGQQHESATLGMWIFLATEVMFIGAIFVAYFTYRLQASYLGAFRDASHNLIFWVGFVNTLVLLSSSLTVVLAIRAAQLNQGKNRIVGWLAITFVLGAMFFGFKVYEYTTDYKEHLWPGLNTLYPDWTPEREQSGQHYFLPEHGFIQKFFPTKEGEPEISLEEAKAKITPAQIGELHNDLDHAKLFYRFYYSLTGLHAFHMLVGLGIFTFLIIQAARGKYTSKSHMQLEICGLYWHFVDIVWIFLFPLLYLVR